MITENKLIVLVLVVTAFIMTGLVFEKGITNYLHETESTVLVAQTKQFVKDKTGQNYNIQSTEWTRPRGLLITGTVGSDVVKFYCSERKGLMYCDHAQTNNTVFLNR